MRFDGEVALITGAARGLGKAYANLLTSRGCLVLTNDLDDADIVGDVATDAESIVSRAIDEHGRLDILINNAGGGAGDALLATHLHGTIAVTQHAWPHLVDAGGGRVIVTSSAATFGTPGVHYPAAKSAMIGLAKSYAKQGAPHGIRANAIMPSAYTRMTSAIPDESFLAFLKEHFPPEKVAPFVVWLVHRDTTITGEVFSVGAGRAARVFVAESPGVALGDAGPEEWSAHADELLSIEGFDVPRSMIDEVRVQAEHLGDEIIAAWRAVGPQRWAGE